MSFDLNKIHIVSVIYKRKKTHFPQQSLFQCTEKQHYKCPAPMLGLEIHEAASTGDYDCLEELVISGKFDLNLGDEDWGNKTPLHWACQKGIL